MRMHRRCVAIVQSGPEAMTAIFLCHNRRKTHISMPLGLAVIRLASTFESTFPVKLVAIHKVLVCE
jgi:hypothetical protein